MRKKILWKDARDAISHSLGRFVSVALLIALGVFALVGLTATSPNMLTTAQNFYRAQHLADLTVISSYGLDDSDRELIEELPGISTVEYGYLADTVIAGRTTSIRVFSETTNLSLFDLRAGRLPTTRGEIALDHRDAESFALGDRITLQEGADSDGSGDPDADPPSILRDHTFTVVGFVRSPELIDDEYFGPTAVGTGQLGGYAVVTPASFDSDVHLIARLAFDNTRMLPAYTAEYDNRVATHATALERLLAPQTEQRLRTLRADKQADIDQGWQKITDAEQRIADGQAQLDDAKQELADARATLREKRREFASSLRNGRERISTAERQLADLRRTIDSAQADLKAAKRQLDAATTTLQLKRKELDAAADQLAQTAAQLDGLKQELDQAEQQISAAEAAIAQRQAVCEALGEDDSGYQQCAAQVAAALAELDVHRAEYQKGAATYQAGVTQWEAGQQAYRRGLKDHAEGTRKLEKGTAEYHKNAARLDQAKRLLNSSTDTLNKARKELATQQAEGEQKIAEAEAEIRDGERSYAEKLAEFEQEKADAEAEIADHRADLQQAQEILDGLELPVYTVADRDANPGYQTFGEYSERIGVLAGVFPVFMFAIAALVSLTSMTRMVDEQRIVMGTFAALGYGRRDIKRKFLLYGFAASTAGAVIGATLGHLLLPPIIYRAYAANFSLDGLALGFHPGVTVLSYAIALACTVGSASLVARGALREVPAHLLAPKPPAKGTRILLERITVLWNRLGFIQKVTARNLFRYKKRMLMTIVGIAGSSALLITGFGLRDSIGGIATQQFGRLMTYDLVAVESDKATAEESTQIARTIADSDQIADHMAVRYENLTFTGGRNNTQQNVTLMVPGEGASFQGFVQLAERTTGNPLALGSEGVVVSEKTASLLNVRPGDRVTLDDSDGVARTLPVAGVAEWYVGHYLFASPQVYAEAFGHPPRSNATLVELQDGASLDLVCADLLALDGMQAILLSESVSRTIESIMGGLNYVILVLITVAIMLAVVITFNLTSINISERIRELSTIKVLGFYPLEVTLYIYRETLLLTVLGILGGYGLGAWLHSFINATLPPDSTMFEPALLASNFAATAAITLAISALIMVVMHFRLKSVNMLDALKSVE